MSAVDEPEGPRYEALAEVLLSSDNPVKAIASLLGDHEARLDRLVIRVNSLEAKAKMAKDRPPTGYAVIER